jgi:hypothetical protein
MIKQIMSILLVVLFISIMVIAGNADGNSTGKDVFLNAKCNMCHSITSQSIEAKKKSDNTPDLSNIGSKAKANDLKTYLKKESELNEKKHPVAFRGEEGDFDVLVTWLMTLKSTK